MVKVDLCLARATNPTDKAYYQMVKDAGWEFITCDSNNRQITVWKGIKKSTIPLPAGIFTILGRTITIESNTRFENLSEVDQTLILNVSIPVQYIEKATRKDLSTIFYRVNLGKTQNAHELRQSWLSDIAQPIRDLSKSLYKSFLNSKTVDQKEINRRLVDEIILDTSIFAYTKFTTRINKTTRDGYYNDVSPLTKVFSVVKSVWKDITIPAAPKPKKNTNTGKMRPVKPLITVRSIINNIMLRIWLKQNDYNILDDSAFDEWVWRTDLDFLEPKPEDQVKFIHPSAGIEYPYRSTGRRDAFYMEFNFKLFISELAKTTGLIELVKKDEQRLFTPSQKYTMWKKQNGVCPETNQEIPLWEILDTTKWQGDHYPIRWVDGGPTTLKNGQLISATVNAAKANQKSVVIPKATLPLELVVENNNEQL